MEGQTLRSPARPMSRLPMESAYCYSDDRIYCPNKEGLYFALEGLEGETEGHMVIRKDELTVGEKTEVSPPQSSSI